MDVGVGDLGVVRARELDLTLRCGHLLAARACMLQGPCFVRVEGEGSTCSTTGCDINSLFRLTALTLQIHSSSGDIACLTLWNTGWAASICRNSLCSRYAVIGVVWRTGGYDLDEDELISVLHTLKRLTGVLRVSPSVAGHKYVGGVV